MSTELEIVGDSVIEWKKLTSKNGASFRVGVPVKKPAGDSQIENKSKGIEQTVTDTITPESKAPFNITVNWELHLNNLWVPAPSDVITVAGITRHRLFKSPSSFYKYRLEITAVEHYDYNFVDATGDIYPINVWINGDHYVDYDSVDPTIVHVKGE